MSVSSVLVFGNFKGLVGTKEIRMNIDKISILNQHVFCQSLYEYIEYETPWVSILKPRDYRERNKHLRLKSIIIQI